MKTFEIGGYVQIVNHKGVTCSCMWSTIHPHNYLRGDKVCRHISQLLKQLEKLKNLKNDNKRN